MEQLTLAIMVAAIAAGLITATFSAVLVRSRRTAFFRFFLANILLYNLLVLTGLAFRYVEMQLQHRGGFPETSSLLPLIFVMSPLKLGWLYAFASMTLVLPGQDLPARFSRRFFSFAGTFLLGWIILLIFGLAAELATFIEAVLLVMEFAVIGGAVICCMLLIVRARSMPVGRRRSSITILGGMYLAVLAFMVASLTLGSLLLGSRSSWHMLLNGIGMVVYNLLPLIWVLRFQPLGPVTSPSGFERYGITPREREIIELICAGQTNQEIADRLFISLATVKDHNHNIFGKTGVRNRVELVNLFRDRKQGGPA